MGNIFTKGLNKDGQKEGLSKGLENIKNKNEELLNAFSAANKVIKAAKNQSEYNYEKSFAFYDFYRGFNKLNGMSLGSKYYEINDFYTLLNTFINTHKATNTETNNRKVRVMKKVVQFYNDCFDLYKQNCGSKQAKDKEKRGLDYKQYEMTDNGDQELKSAKKEETRTKNT